MVGLAATLCVGGFVVIMWIVVDGGSPSLALLAPAAGSFTNDSTPAFTGRASDSSTDRTSISASIAVFGRKVAHCELR